MTQYVSIKDGKTPAPTPPDIIDVAITAEDGNILASIPVDNPKRNDAVEWWMYVNGYMPVEDGVTKDESNIRGKPIPEAEVERGAKVTRKSISNELKFWKTIPELADHVPDEMIVD